MNTDTRYSGMERIPILTQTIKDVVRHLAMRLAGVNPPEPGREETYGYRMAVARVSRSIRNSDEGWKLRRNVRRLYAARLYRFN